MCSFTSAKNADNSLSGSFFYSFKERVYVLLWELYCRGRSPRLGALKCCSNGYEKVNFIGPTVEIKDLLSESKKEKA